MKIKPGMLCWIGWVPEGLRGNKYKMGRQVEVMERKFSGACAVCSLGARIWIVKDISGGIGTACECVLIPIPPDSKKVDKSKDKELVVDT